MNNFTNDEAVETVIKPISILSYLHTIILSLIPILGLFYSLIGSFKPNTDINRKNLSRAMLIFQVLIITILFLLFFYVWNNVITPLLNTINNGLIPTSTKETTIESMEETLNQVKGYQGTDILEYLNSLQ